MIAAVMGLVALGLIVVAVRWPAYLVPAAIVCCVFEGAAVVNAGGLGISPYYFTLLLIGGRCLFLRIQPHDALGHSTTVRRVMGCAIALLVIGLGSAVVLPRVFAGWGVLSPRLDADAVAPLHFSTSNIGQAVYLALNVAMLWYTAQTCRTSAVARRMVNAFTLAGALVVALALYQLAALTLHLPFPDDLLYSNDAYVMQAGTAVLDMPRICSTFTEPSSLAVFLVGFVAFQMTRLESNGYARWPGVALLIGALLALILSTSSTAYVGLAGLAAWAVGRYLLLPMLNGRGNLRAALGLSVMIAAVVVTYASSPTLREVVQATVFDKDQSASYEERSQADRFSMKLAEDTWGLGVGLGSNRASSFFPSIISTIGVFGAGAFGLLVVMMIMPDADSFFEGRTALSAALVGLVAAKVISSPDLATPSVWAVMAALVAVRAAAPQEDVAVVEDYPDVPPLRVRRKKPFLIPG